LRPNGGRKIRRAQFNELLCWCRANQSQRQRTENNFIRHHEISALAKTTKWQGRRRRRLSNLPHNKALHPTAYSPLVPRSLPAAGELGRSVAARGLDGCGILNQK